MTIFFRYPSKIFLWCGFLFFWLQEEHFWLLKATPKFAGSPSCLTGTLPSSIFLPSFSPHEFQLHRIILPTPRRRSGDSHSFLGGSRSGTLRVPGCSWLWLRFFLGKGNIFGESHHNHTHTYRKETHRLSHRSSWRSVGYQMRWFLDTFFFQLFAPKPKVHSHFSCTIFGCW